MSRFFSLFHVFLFRAVALVFGTLLACSTSGPAPASKEAGFCDALAAAYARCSGASACASTLAADCTKMASLFAPSILERAGACVASTPCGTEPLVCLGNALEGATASAAQTKLATDYCASCSVVGGDACATAFFGTANVPGLGFALLPFGDAPLQAIDEACTSSKLGKTACQAGFTTCLSATTTKALAQSVSVDSAKCLVDGIKDGLAGIGKDGGAGATGATCQGCAGCCHDGVCETGDKAGACGAGGAACATCQGTTECKTGRCVGACGPDNCAGCCDASGTCHTTGDATACGTGGGACMACPSSSLCARGQCIDPACKATCASGCCTSAGCADGLTNAACGSGGDACAVCASGLSCTSGTCQAGAGAYFDFVAVGARLPSRNQSGGSWDAFGGLPDPYLVAISGPQVGKTPVLTDTIDPTWNITVLSASTATELMTSLEIKVFDSDVAFDDFVGGCVVKLDPTTFDGALHTLTCPMMGANLPFEFDYRVKAH